MRKLLITSAIALSLTAASASADQQTLTAIQAAGVSLTEAQATELGNATCNESDCQALIDQVAALVAANATDEATVSAILLAAFAAHPEFAIQFGEAAIAAAPEATAIIAQIMTESVPTAAGPGTNNGENGRSIARGVANINNNIPSPPGGGGSSSPN